MILVTPLSARRIATLLKEQVDVWPGFWSCLVSLNGRYWRGTSTVCGSVDDAGFRLRNRQGPAYSIEAIGQFRPNRLGTEIEISFREPFLASAYEWLLHRRALDQEVILDFVRQTLGIAEPGGSTEPGGSASVSNRTSSAPGR